MLPHPTPRSASTSAPGVNAPPPLLPLPDLALLLEQHVIAGFPSDLALDLVLNELVARAADATHASAAALALLRGKLMVCRAATGLHAPDLGVPLDTRDGLSGACARSRTPQVSDDTECDPRVDPAISRRLGIRSMLVVPVFAYKMTATDRNPPLTGVLEVFSPLANSFTLQAQVLLTDFADECARIHNVANQLQSRPRVDIVQAHDDLILSDTDTATSSAGTNNVGTDIFGTHHVENVGMRDVGTDNVETSNTMSSDSSVLAVQAAVHDHADVRSLLIDEELATQVFEPEPLPSSDEAADRKLRIAPPRQPYEVWTLILGGLVILAAAAFSFMIGSRIGWLHSEQPASAITSQPAQTSEAAQPASSRTGADAKSSAHNKNSERTPALPQKDASKSKGRDNSTSAGDELVVYNNGKVVFRMKPTTAEERNPSAAERASAQPASSNPTNSIWLAPTEAESRLITRTEPHYPADALAAHRSGNVTLEVQVAEDGTVSSVSTLSGDPLLAAAAAQAVRNWRYQPYRANHHPSQFQTDVTLTFSLPN
jgi:TonB family protein